MNKNVKLEAKDSKSAVLVLPESVTTLDETLIPRRVRLGPALATPSETPTASKPPDPGTKVSWCLGVTGALDETTVEDVCRAIASEDMRKRIEPIRADYERVIAETGDKKKAKE